MESPKSIVVPPLPRTLRLETEEQVAAVKALRQRAANLRGRVSRGEYDDNEAHEFWELVRRSSLTLFVSNTQLSERAGLGKRFFATAYGRFPKYPNMLRALGAIVEASNDVLGVARGGSAGEAEWVENAFLSSPEHLARVEADLTSLILHLKSSNSLSEVPELDALWRANLIALLETTIAVLRSPLVEPTLLNRVSRTLAAASKKVAADSSAGFFGGLAGAAAVELAKMALQLGG